MYSTTSVYLRYHPLSGEFDVVEQRMYLDELIDDDELPYEDYDEVTLIHGVHTVPDSTGLEASWFDTNKAIDAARRWLGILRWTGNVPQGEKDFHPHDGSINVAKAVW